MPSPPFGLQVASYFALFPPPPLPCRRSAGQAARSPRAAFPHFALCTSVLPCPFAASRFPTAFRPTSVRGFRPGFALVCTDQINPRYDVCARVYYSLPPPLPPPLGLPPLLLVAAVCVRAHVCVRACIGRSAHARVFCRSARARVHMTVRVHVTVRLDGAHLHQVTHCALTRAHRYPGKQFKTFP